MINRGINLALERKHQSEKDWVFGYMSKPCIADIPLDERDRYLPKGERQNIGDEKMDCATRGPINICETKFNYLYTNNKISKENKDWLFKNGYVNSEDKIEFSDAFIAIKSGTTAYGNSLIAPLKAMENSGLIPKKLLPQLEMFWDYYNPKRITRDIENLGLEFKRRFPMNYEKVLSVHFAELEKEDLIDVAGNAWPEPVNGEYPKNDGTINHCFILFKAPAHNAFDNYEEDPGDFTKKLASDYVFFDYGYRLFFSENTEPVKPSIMPAFLAEFWKKLSVIWIIKR